MSGLNFVPFGGELRNRKKFFVPTLNHGPPSGSRTSAPLVLFNGQPLDVTLNPSKTTTPLTTNPPTSTNPPAVAVEAQHEIAKHAAVVVFGVFSCFLVAHFYAISQYPHRMHFIENILVHQHNDSASDNNDHINDVIIKSSVRVAVLWLVHFCCSVFSLCAIIIDATTVLLSSNPLKRNASFLLLPTNMLMFATHVSVGLGLVPYYITPNKTVILPLRFIEMSLSVPMLILTNFLLCNSGVMMLNATLSLRHILVIVCSFVSIAFGFVCAVLIDDKSAVSLSLGALSLLVSVVAWLVVVSHSRAVVLKYSDHTFTTSPNKTEKLMWTGLYSVALLVWPVVLGTCVLQASRLISPLTTEMILALCDVVGKLSFTLAFATHTFAVPITTATTTLSHNSNMMNTRTNTNPIQLPPHSHSQTKTQSQPILSSLSQNSNDNDTSNSSSNPNKTLLPHSNPSTSSSASYCTMRSAFGNIEPSTTAFAADPFSSLHFPSHLSRSSNSLPSPPSPSPSPLQSITSLHSSDEFHLFLSKCMAHEMRGPLNTVIAHNTMLVESGVVQGESLLNAAEALASAETLMCQVDCALEYSAYEREGIRLNSEQVDLVSVLDSVVGKNRHRACTRWLDFQVVYPGNVIVTTDPRHVTSIIDLLVDNALKFAHERSVVRVVVSVRLANANNTNSDNSGNSSDNSGNNSDSNGNGNNNNSSGSESNFDDCDSFSMLPELSLLEGRLDQDEMVISVHNGRSELIDPQQADVMFSPFRVAMTPHRQSAFSGNGLGLAVVEAKVRAFQGSIHVTTSAADPHIGHSMPVSGQSFNIVVRLPLLDGPDQVVRELVEEGSSHVRPRATIVPAGIYGVSDTAVIVGRNVSRGLASSVVPLAALRACMRVYYEGEGQPGCDWDLPSDSEVKVIIVESHAKYAARLSLRLKTWAQRCGRHLSVLLLNAIDLESFDAGKHIGVHTDGQSEDCSVLQPDGIVLVPSPVSALVGELNNIAIKAHIQYSRMAMSANHSVTNPITAPTAADSSVHANVNTMKPAVPISTASRGGGSPFRVMVVDDNKPSLMLLSLLLKKMGCVVVTCSSALDALHQIRFTVMTSEHFDCVLVDLRMAGAVDGLNTARAIRTIENSGSATHGGEDATSNNASTEKPFVRHFVVALTSNSTSCDRQAALAAGCDELILKPIKHVALKNVLEVAMFRRRSHRTPT